MAEQKMPKQQKWNISECFFLLLKWAKSIRPENTKKTNEIHSRKMCGGRKIREKFVIVAQSSWRVERLVGVLLDRRGENA